VFRRLIGAFILGVVSLVCVYGQSSVPPLAETELDIKLPEGISIGPDFLKLLSGDLNMNLYIYKEYLPMKYSLLHSSVDLIPYTDGYWPYHRDGSKVATQNLFTDPLTSYKQLVTRWELTLYQGLYRNPEKPMSAYLNQWNLYLGYTGNYTQPYLNSNPEAYLLQDPEIEDAWLGNIVKTGLLFYDVRNNRLINTRKGISGQLQLEWAPRELANDLMGVSDFLRLSCSISGNIPLVERRKFSLYLFQRAGWDRIWGEDLPPAASFGIASLPFSAGYGSVRGAILWNSPWHGTTVLELRGSFPTLFEPGMMPGFSLFWDFGMTEEQRENALGASFVVHLDAASIIPHMTAAQLDLQFGSNYSFQSEDFMFYFNMVLPQ